MDTKKINAGNVKLIAHRGLSLLERENTNAAFVAAGNRSYFGIETDVHKTADGQFVIIHDETTQRVTLGRETVNVEESPYDRINEVILADMDGSFHRQDLRVPLLVDYVKICKRYDKVCVLELKNAFNEEDIRGIIDEIRAVDYLEKVIFISFFMENCVILRRLLADNDIQFLYDGEITDELLHTMKEHRLNMDMYYRNMSQADVDKLHANGITVNCWTCDVPEDGERLVAMGVDYITTDILEGK